MTVSSTLSFGRLPRPALLAALALVLITPPAHAACPPIEVRVSGTITRELDGSPVRDYPVTIRMEGVLEGLRSIQWDAVVTDKEGRYLWTKTFPRDPCREGSPILGFPGRLWGWITHVRSEAYHHGAKQLPERIRLQTEKRSIPISRSRLISGLDAQGRVSTVTIDFSL